MQIVQNIPDLGGVNKLWNIHSKWIKMLALGTNTPDNFEKDFPA
jgi:hypothetical protein